MTDSFDAGTRRGQRRRTLGLLFAAAVAAPFADLPQAQAAGAPREVRIGYQKYGTLTLLKGRGTLEKRLAEKNIAVKWTEFPAGPALLEGLNVGSIDFGTVGEAPPIFAQAAGREPGLCRQRAAVAGFGGDRGAEDVATPQRGRAERARKVALNKGSNVHFLLVKALEKAGVDYREIQPIYLPPAEARAAFERGSVDAWVIWDPFLAAAEKQLGARMLADGKGLVANHQFYVAARPLRRAVSGGRAHPARRTGQGRRVGPHAPAGSRRRSSRRRPGLPWTSWPWRDGAIRMA
jgi:sulfonate transport system substrate-binding protein